MHKNSLVLLATVFFFFGILSACSTQTVDEKQYSGYLNDYSKLTERKDDDGGAGMVWFADDISSRGYQKVIIDPVIIYPVSADESPSTSKIKKELTTYLTTAIQAKMGNHLIITEQAGANTIRMRTAITGVTISNEDLAAYEYIPVALIFAGAKTAAGKRAQEVEVFLETSMSDSLSGEVIGRAVRQGFGDELENKDTELKTEDILPQLDRWAEDAGQIAAKLLGA